MPTIEVDSTDFDHMLGVKLEKTSEKFNDILALVKGEAKLISEDNVISIEIKDTNRPDLWNVEGITRSLRRFLDIDKDFQRYTISDESKVDIYVDPQLKDLRPYIGCTIIKGIKLNDTIIRGLMHLQEKLDQTYGRNRRRTSIGLYDFSQISPPLYYTVANPKEISFIPLGFTEKMTLKEILERHPKGIEYSHILKKRSVYPILTDSNRKILSFPPIINSNDLGRITSNTNHILIEVTGTVKEIVLNSLNIVTLSFIDRGGKAHSTTVSYPNDIKSVTPNLKTRTMNLDTKYIHTVLGLQLTTKEASKLLRKSGFNIKKIKNNLLTIEIPCYRIDIMHSVDIIEDIAIAYGYNNIEPLIRKLPTTGGMRPESIKRNDARELMIGLGFQEVFTYSLTNPENLFIKMNSRKEKIVEIANPKVQTLTCLRNQLLPSLIEFLSANVHFEYPQKIFEIGSVIRLNKNQELKTDDEEHLAAVIAHANAGFSEIKSNLDAFLMHFGIKWRIKEIVHSSFIKGRVGNILVKNLIVGRIGEVHPKVLEAWKLETPVVAFEVDIQRLLE